MDLPTKTPALHSPLSGIHRSECETGCRYMASYQSSIRTWRMQPGRTERGKPKAEDHTHLRWTSWAPGTWQGAFSTVLSQWQLWQDPCNSRNAPDTTGSSCCAAERPQRGDIHQVRPSPGPSNRLTGLLSLSPLAGWMRPISKAPSNLPVAPGPLSTLASKWKQKEEQSST